MRAGHAPGRDAGDARASTCPNLGHQAAALPVICRLDLLGLFLFCEKVKTPVAMPEPKAPSVPHKLQQTGTTAPPKHNRCQLIL
jgi:hypothetical protein